MLLLAGIAAQTARFVWDVPQAAGWAFIGAFWLALAAAGLALSTADHRRRRGESQCTQG